MKFHPRHRACAVLAIAASLLPGMLPAEPREIGSIGRGEILERAEPLLDALDLTKERREKLIDELAALHSGETAELRIPDFNGREGAETIRGFMSHHGFTGII